MTPREDFCFQARMQEMKETGRVRLAVSLIYTFPPFSSVFFCAMTHRFPLTAVWVINETRILVSMLYEMRNISSLPSVNLLLVCCVCRPRTTSSAGAIATFSLPASSCACCEKPTWSIVEDTPRPRYAEQGVCCNPERPALGRLSGCFDLRTG